MGRLFYNPYNGEIWESNRRQRVPPTAQFVETDVYVDYRYTRKYVARTVKCPTCGLYHFWGAARRATIPVEVEYIMKWTEEFGCEKARKLGRCAYRLSINDRKDYERLTMAARHIGIEALESISAETRLVARSYDSTKSIGRKILAAIIRSAAKNIV